MRIDIVIPSKGRTGKLAKCLSSVLSQVLGERISGLSIIVYMDTEEEISNYKNLCPEPILASDYFDFRIIPFPYTAPKLWNYHLKNMTADGMMYLSDDVELLPGCIKQARMHYLLMYPRYDGVVGITQANLEGKFDTAPAAFGLIGRAFADKFPNRAAFCPDYKHLYIDRELEMYARSIDKFWFSIAALTHHHPCTGREFSDDTHTNIRRFKAGDKATWDERRRRNLLWGVSFEHVNRGA